MKLGIMQPYFFPYIGYYDLINRTDRWIVFDVVKYVPKSWMNRNRILHPTSGWQYITVPVDKHSEGGLIKDVVLLDKADSQRRVLGQIEHYRTGRAPFFRATRELIERCFSESPGNKLRDLNTKTLELVCRYLGIAYHAQTLSAMDLALPQIDHPGGWALEIASALGAAEYVNPPGGRAIFKPAEWDERNVKLTFTDALDFRYPVKEYAFVERLSIVDVMMWNEPEAIKAYLDRAAETAIS
jgi:hypothetical protein